MTLTAPQETKALRGRTTSILSKAALDSSGTLSGYGAIFGNRDDGGDIIAPGFFADVIGDFLRTGFLSWGHDWLVPCAMPTMAAEDDIGLLLAATFHSDAESQRYRTIAAERLAAGLTMGLSIGYEIAPGGWRQTAQGRVLVKASRLFEVGLVLVPMNREAGATDVKTSAKAAGENAWTASYVLSLILGLIQDEAEDIDPGDLDATEDVADVATLGQIRDLILQYLTSTAREVGTPDDLADVAEEEAAAAAMWSDYGWMGHGLTFAKHQERAERDLKTLIRRAGAIARPRKEGRVLSSNNRDRLEGLTQTLAGAADELKGLLASTDAPGIKANAIAALVEEARFLGVSIPE